MNADIIKYNDNPEFACSEAKRILHAGSPIIFPTETVYGLGCLISDIKAAEKIYQIKQRDAGKPLAAHICNLNQVKDLVEEIPDIFYQLSEKYLPGPLAIIMRKKSSISDVITSGMDTISIRYPDDIACLSIIERAGQPLAATSANLSGEPAIISGEMLPESILNEVGLVIDIGRTQYAKESTVISIVTGDIQILREGVVKL